MNYSPLFILMFSPSYLSLLNSSGLDGSIGGGGGGGVKLLSHRHTSVVSIMLSLSYMSVTLRSVLMASIGRSYRD